MDEKSLREAYRNLMNVNNSTFDGGEYNVAYHALMAALHCAHSLKEISYLQDIAGIARNQLAWVDANVPEYEHSTRSAASRSHSSIFHTLAGQADATVALIKSESSLKLSRKL